VPELTETSVIGMISPDVAVNDSVTQVNVTYNQNFANDSDKTLSYSDDQLRQKRGLTKHSILDATIPVTNRRGAQLYAEYQVNMRGKPRRVYNVTATNQFKTTEPGDTLRLNYSPLGIDQVVNVIEVTQVPGKIEVGIKAMDVFGFQDQPGFWTDASAPDWDDTWTDDEVLERRENSGFWEDANGYADVSDDPERSYLASIWS
jgi:hypothetical protein